jgi:hypothetical protein
LLELLLKHLFLFLNLEIYLWLVKLFEISLRFLRFLRLWFFIDISLIGSQVSSQRSTPRLRILILPFVRRLRKQCVRLEGAMLLKFTHFFRIFET